MNVGEKVRLKANEHDVPAGAVGVVLRVEEQSGFDERQQADWWIEHLEVDFGKHGVHWVTDFDVEAKGI